MSRTEKNKRREELKKTFVYPIAAIAVVFFVLLFIIDYRANASKGQNEISIIEVAKRDDDLIAFKVFGSEMFNINTYYLKKDIKKFKNEIIYYSNVFSNTIVEAVKQY